MPRNRSSPARPSGGCQIQNALRGELRKMSGVRPTISGSRSIFGGFGQPIQINVQGPEENRLKARFELVGLLES